MIWIILVAAYLVVGACAAIGNGLAIISDGRNPAAYTRDLIIVVLIWPVVTLTVAFARLFSK